MYKLNSITNKAKQKLTWINEEGEEVILTFEYRPMQLGWFIGIEYGDNVNYKNIRLTTNANLFRNYNNYLPFGLCCITNDGLEPMSINDFSSNYATIYMLNRNECRLFEDKFYAKVSA